MGRGRARRRRAVLAVATLALVGLVGLVVWLAVCVDVLMHPEVDPQQPVDAAYVLGPVETRIEDARAVLAAGVAPVLLATTSVNAQTGEPFATGHCGMVTDGYRVECVLPDPYSTRGEARVLGEQVEAQGWSRVAVLTSTPHAARARMLAERCTDAEVLVWTVGVEPHGVRGWAGAFVYQSAAWAKAQLVRGC
jgi:hypothetical protein